MDFNRLYFDHQVLLMGGPESVPSDKHDAAARLLAGRIGRSQRTLGAPGAAGWEAAALAPPALSA